jgi:hypothetical protein
MWESKIRVELDDNYDEVKKEKTKSEFESDHLVFLHVIIRA